MLISVFYGNKLLPVSSVCVYARGCVRVCMCWCMCVGGRTSTHIMLNAYCICACVLA